MDVPARRRANEAVFDVTPSASRLTSSLRDIGYDFVGALGDIVDNSVSASASRVDVEIVFDGFKSYVLIADDGVGMTESQLNEALRFGSRRLYGADELGRYGLGLKTASLSQCRRVTVASRRSLSHRRIVMRTLDVDHVAATDRWEITEPPPDSAATRALDWLEDCPGTVVIWENLDRVLPESRPQGGWARRRLDGLRSKAIDHLGMVFHRFIERDTRLERFLEGSASGDGTFAITVNGEKVRPWNPFAPTELGRTELPEQLFEVAVGSQHGYVSLQRFVLPPRESFSSPSEFDRMSGPLRWNRQQGLYIYRANRLVQAGGWSGLRAADEHTKFARAALDFQTTLDALFQINVAKMRVSVPPEVRAQLEKPIGELCHRADSLYRRSATRGRGRSARGSGPAQPTFGDTGNVGAALLSAALDIGEHESLMRVLDRLRQLSPDAAHSLGW